MMFFIELLCCILLVDFITGLFHWMEDSYGTENTPIIGKLIILPNLEHHLHPMAFTKSTYWARNALTIYAAIAFAIVSYLLGILTVSWAIALLIGSQGNQIHHYTHIRHCDVPWPVRWLQNCQILQTKAHHMGGHHMRPFDDHYCIVTNVMNPMLDRIRFWRGMELVIWSVTGVRPRHQTT